jgi:acetyl-CoA carboxylase biotin carboxyl carrier protein
MLEFDEIRKVLELARKHGFREVETEVGGISFSAKLEPVSLNPVLDSEPTDSVGTSAENDRLVANVCAPCVGYFQQSKTPYQVGQSVEVNDVVATILALGLSNDVEAKLNGEIIDVLAKHEQPVEFGQTLFRIKVNS